MTRVLGAGILICLLAAARICQAGEMEMLKALKITCYKQGEATKQVPITAVPDALKNQKCAVLTGPSMLDITRNGKNKLTEGSLLLWVYIPPKLTIKAREEYNVLLFILGNDLMKNSKKPSLCYVSAKLSLDDAPKDNLVLSSEIRGDGDIAGFPIEQSYSLKGWQQLTLCFAQKYAAVYANGVLVSCCSQDNAKDLFLPLNADNLLIRNGTISLLRNGKYEAEGADIGMVGVGKIQVIDRCLGTEEVRSYRESEKLPEGVKTVWTIDFSKGRPDKNAGTVKSFGKIDYKEIRE